MVSFVNLIISIVSIHAPTRGATFAILGVAADGAVSIHAPTRGATVRKWSYLMRSSSFNSRTHAGCDL